MFLIEQCRIAGVLRWKSPCTTVTSLECVLASESSCDIGRKATTMLAAFRVVTMICAPVNAISQLNLTITIGMRDWCDWSGSRGDYYTAAGECSNSVTQLEIRINPIIMNAKHLADDSTTQ